MALVTSTNHAYTRPNCLADWDCRRAIIETLYWHEDKELPEVMEIMRTEHGFAATRRQYKGQLQKWGLEKNVKEVEMLAMIRIRKKRKERHDKDTDFFLRKRPVRADKIDRFVKRRKIDEDRPETLSSAPTPADLDYCTPAKPITTPTPAHDLTDPVDFVEDDVAVQGGADMIHDHLFAAWQELASDEVSFHTPQPVVDWGPETANIPSTPLRPALDSLQDSEIPSNDIGSSYYINEDLTMKFDQTHLGGGAGGTANVDIAVSEYHFQHDDFSGVWNIPAGPGSADVSSGGSTPRATTHIPDNEVPSNRSSSPPFHASVVLQQTMEEASQRSLSAPPDADDLSLGVDSRSSTSASPASAGDGEDFERHHNTRHELDQTGRMASLRNEQSEDLDDSIEDRHDNDDFDSDDSSSLVEITSSQFPHPIRLYEDDSVYNIPLSEYDEAIHKATLDDVPRVGDDPLRGVALRQAVRRGDENSVHTMLLKGADPNECSSKGMNALHLAAYRGHARIITTLLDHNANPNQPVQGGFETRVGKTTEFLEVDDLGPLHLAAHGGHVEAVRVLLLNGAITEVKDSFRRMPLHYAAIYGHLAVADALLQHGAQVDGGRDDLTPLHCAVELGHEDLVKKLIQGGADVNALCNYLGPLDFAAEHDHAGIVRLLLSHGACPDGYTRHGSTLLFAAVIKGHQDVVQAFLDFGNIVNIEKPSYREETSALQAAAQRGELKIMKMLLSHGALLTTRNIFGHTPLHSAVKGGHLEAVKLLLDHGADPNIKDNSSKLPIHLAAASKADTATGMCSALISHGSSIDACDCLEQSALHVALSDNHEAMIDLLLKAGADPNMRTFRSHRPLNVAVDQKNPATCRLLLEHGADPREEGRDRSILAKTLFAQHDAAFDRTGIETPKWILAEKDAFDLVALFGKYDERVLSETDEDGHSLLGWAAKCGYSSLVKLALQSGAKINNHDTLGMTALNYATHRNHLDVVKILLECGAVHGPHSAIEAS